MADLTSQALSQSGITPALVAADAAGDTFGNSGRTFVEIRNDDASPKTITIITEATAEGLAIEDVSIALAAGARVLAGPFKTSLFNNAQGRVAVSYDDVTSVTIGVFELPLTI